MNLFFFELVTTEEAWCWGLRGSALDHNDRFPDCTWIVVTGLPNDFFSCMLHRFTDGQLLLVNDGTQLDIGDVDPRVLNPCISLHCKDSRSKALYS
jgi:hypothetical protein